MHNILRKTREVREELQSIMWKHVGIVRSTTRLNSAEQKIAHLEAKWESYLFEQGWKQTMVGLEACEMRNLFCCAKLVVSSALARQESRGLHYTTDFPHVEESKRLPTIIFPSPINSTWSSRQLHKLPVCQQAQDLFPSTTCKNLLFTEHLYSLHQKTCNKYLQQELMCSLQHLENRFRLSYLKFFLFHLIFFYTDCF